jgi:ABC-type sugar transport system substrate-binding protein
MMKKSRKLLLPALLALMLAGGIVVFLSLSPAEPDTAPPQPPSKVLPPPGSNPESMRQVPDASLVRKRISIGCFSSLNKDHAFWQSVRAFMDAVAEDLRVELRWHYAKHDQIRGREQIRNELSGPHPIDAALVVNFKNQGEHFFTLLDRHKVPTFIHVVGANHAKSGGPRKKHPFWVGELVIDEVRVGHDLAITLIQDARRKGLQAADGKIHLVAITGDRATLLSRQRRQGLDKALRERSDLVVHHQSVPTLRWSTAEGRAKVKKLLARYPETSVVWAANDDIAIGVVKGIRDLGKIPGKDIVTGGVDLVPEALRLVSTGEMVCSFGGLSMHGGWAAILLYDYFAGIDFKDDPGPSVTTKAMLINKGNVGGYLKTFGDGDWRKVDFRQFSKALNPQLKKYDFSMSRIMGDIRPTESGAGKASRLQE